MIVAAAALTLGPSVLAQEKLGSSAPEPSFHAGWTVTPAFGFGETYDDNISLFGRGTAENQNDDYIATYFPAIDAHYSGKHTRFGAGYSGSFLDYQTFSALNRWDQRAKVDVRRQETARLKWTAHGATAMLPSTEAVELGGIPYRHTGARTSELRAGTAYSLRAHDGISAAAIFQSVNFDRPEEVRAVLRGGHVLELASGWRHKMDRRLALGAEYSFRHASVVGDREQFNIHTSGAAVDYDISPVWSFSGAAGFVHLESTATTAARTGPAWRLAVERQRGGATFHAGYLRSYIPSFGFGGTIQNQEVGVGFHLPLFGNRRMYTDHSMVFRDDKPLTDLIEQLPLRSLRTYSIFGWAPQPWVRLEGFYARVEQTSLRAGGRLSRNRIGFQIVTSKPLRVK
jgi:hypothetical protein